MRRFRPALLAGLAVVLVLTVTVLQSSIQRNLGSLTYLRAPDAGSLPPGDHARHAFWRAAAALADGDAAAALALILPEASAGDRVARHLAGWAAFRAGETAIAVDLWLQNRDDRSINQAIAENTRDGAPADTYALYRALDRMDRRDAAAGYARFLAAQGAVDQALALLAGMVRDYPTAAQRSGWLQAWAEIARRAERWDDATAALHLLAAEPGQAGAALTQLGQVYELRGDLDAALDALRQAMQQDPGYADAYAAAAAILTRSSAYADADRLYADALARKPERSDWALARAQTRHAAGDPAGALRLYAEAAQAYPDHAGVQYEAARAFAQAEAWGAARDAILAAIAAAPKPNAAYHRLAATIYRALDDADAAAYHTQAATQQP